MLSLWTRLLALYGSKWEKEYGTVDSESYALWYQALRKFKPHQIRRGLEALIAEGSDFVPTMNKFMHLCRTVPAYEGMTPYKELPRPKPRYSVMRIERAKQQFMFGNAFTIPNSRGKHVIDWTREDEDVLTGILAGMHPDASHEELNAAIDYVEFSHGRQIDNAYPPEGK